MNDSGLEKIRHQTRTIVDRLGMPIDPGIFETVVALRSHNINTISSCEGHLDRITGGPYVIFEAPGVRAYEEAYRTISNRRSTEYKNKYNQARAMNLAEAKKVMALLDGFYKTRTTSANQRIIVDYLGSFTGKLVCQSADIARILPVNEQEQLLRKNQIEMRAFTDYLLAIKVKTPRAT